MSRDAELVRQAVEASRMTIADFAQRVTFGRDVRTVKRWLAGEALPRVARERLTWFVSLSPADRDAYLVLLGSP